ncbi:unannotated protein [freshwater metagenome]|uniref:Unannotated protein n=1 Tax=freshwater metagenome TaxID=449393 RepID=A0A6J7ADA9_9ZZZZ
MAGLEGVVVAAVLDDGPVGWLLVPWPFDPAPEPAVVVLGRMALVSSVAGVDWVSTLASTDRLP